MRFNSILRASLAVVVIIASIVCSSDAATQYVNSATICGRCANFSIQAGSTVVFNGVQTKVTTGYVGISPGTTSSGTPQYGTGYGLEANSAAAQNCAADEKIAYGNLTAVTCTTTLPSTDLAGLTLYPGVYCTTAGYFTLTAGALSLNANGSATAQFIFQTASTLITSASTSILLLNDAVATNVFWQIGSSATLAANSVFVGQIFAYASITVEGTVKVCGRLCAEAEVSFAGNDQVTLPSNC